MTHQTYDKVILVRMGELTLKGLNRGKFEKKLVQNLRRRLDPLGRFKVTQSHARIWVEPAGGEVLPEHPEAILQAVTQVFGIVSTSLVWRFSGDYDTLRSFAAAYAHTILADGRPRTFKVETHRADKRFPMTSPQISSAIGGFLLESEPELLTVDVHHPDLTLHIEIRDQFYLYHEIVYGQKGLPVGTSGQGMLLLSGGIDSPVAGYMMASRGMALHAIYFHAFPYTSDRAKEKVIDLARQIAIFSGRINLHIVDFTDIQVTLRDHCPSELLTVIIRRMMMRIASHLADQKGCQALITGESLGQVASQTAEALACTNVIASQPVFRPLIGLDKDETVQIARRIGTYETSILPYEDCCTIFVARHPKTRPSLDEIERAEQGLDLETLTLQGIDRIEEVRI